MRESRRAKIFTGKIHQNHIVFVVYGDVELNAHSKELLILASDNLYRLIF